MKSLSQTRQNLIIVILFAAVMLTSITGCSGTKQSNTTVESSSATTEATEGIQTETTAASTSESQEIETISLTDMADREFELDGPAERIVALTAADVEILYAVGAGSTIVGRGEYCDYPQEVIDIPAVQSGSETNIEQVISLEPDVIIMGTMDQTVDQIESFEKAGITVIVTDAQDISGIFDAIALIGSITGHETESVKLAEQMKSDFAEIEALASEKQPEMKNSIYFEVSPLEWGLWTAGSNTFMNELAEMIGLENSFADVNQWGEVSQEQVIERNPDYIVTITMYYGEGPLPEDEIMARPGWSDISAVNNKNVFNANSDELSRPGPRLTDGIRSLYEFVYNS